MRRTVPLAYGLITLLVLLGTALCPPARAQEPAARAYTVSVIPAVPPSDIKRRWQPLLEQLSRETGLHFHFRFYDDFQAFEAGLDSTEPDFVIMSPVQVWRLRHSYRPFLRSNLGLIGMVVVQKESDIRQLSDLEKRTLTMQPGETLAANPLLLHRLKEQGITPLLLAAKTESNALRSVVMRKADAALVSNYAMKLMPSGFLPQLRIIHQTLELPPPALCASQRIPTADVAKVKAAMLKFQGAQTQLLQSILMTDITEADLDRDYSIVGKLLPSEAGNGGR
jgi:ABC-type phosphate/phosphonate transport system substrate-binding protein